MSETNFQFIKRTNSLNVNPNEFNEVNSKISKFCEQAQVNPSNIRELFDNLLDFALFNTKPIEGNQDEINALQSEINLKSDEINALNSEITLKSEAIEALTTELEIERNSKETLENQVNSQNENLNSVAENLKGKLIIPVSDQEIQVLEGIAQNRLNANYDAELNSPGQIMKRMCFTKSRLFNHDYVFFTGL